MFRTWFSIVVFPAPRKPDKTVTGSFRMEIKKPVELAEPQPGRNSHVGTVDRMNVML